VVEDQKQLPQSAKAASAARDGNALVNVGFAYVSGGQFDTGIPMMEQGIAKGGLRRPDEAKLHLGIAYLSAGRKADAKRVFEEDLKHNPLNPRSLFGLGRKVPGWKGGPVRMEDL